MHLKRVTLTAVRYTKWCKFMFKFSALKKLKRNWIGPLRIQAMLDDTHYLVSDLTG